MLCQIALAADHARLSPQITPAKSLHHPGVFTPFSSIAIALDNRFCRVSSLFASLIQRQYSLRCV
jgi:hypothetical protein